MVRKRDVEVNTAKQITLFESGPNRPAFRQEKPRLFLACGNSRLGALGAIAAGDRRQSGKSMKYLLNVLVLLELVDEGEHFCGLLFG